MISSSASHAVTLVPITPPLVIDQQSQWLLSFDLATWLVALDLTGVRPGPDGIRIDSASHAELLPPIEARLGTGEALRRDSNGDGQVDAQDVPVALP